MEQILTNQSAIQLLLDIDYLLSLKDELYSALSPVESCKVFIDKKITENRADSKDVMAISQTLNKTPERLNLLSVEMNAALDKYTEIQRHIDSIYHEAGQNNNKDITISLVDKCKSSFYGVVFGLPDYQEFIWDIENIQTCFNGVLELLGKIDTASNDKIIEGLESLRVGLDSQTDIFYVSIKTIDAHIAKKTPLEASRYILIDAGDDVDY